MENHPIPQDITGFQFKLIGKMTVKQFAYLAAGVVPAWFIFFILPFPFLLRLPISLFFLILGVSLAFVPVDGRPLDVMIRHLIRALFAPTDYLYRKTGGNISQQIYSVPLSQPSQAQQVTTQQAPPSPVPTIPLNQAQAFTQPLSQPPIGPIIQLDEEEEEKKEEKELIENEKKLDDQATLLQEKLEQAKSAEKTVITDQPSLPVQVQETTHQKSEELEKLLTETTRQKEALEKELLSLRARLEGQQQEKYAPGVATPLKQTQRVRKVPQGMEKAVGLPTTPQDPNLIVGIIKDPRGNPLPNILVEVKDPEDNPVRAFKTNGLGQFASATSLSNGKYIIIFEDPAGKNKFDAVEIEATGTPLMPLEIFSVDPREELRRELFT